jgi:hypothetical protein
MLDQVLDARASSLEIFTKTFVTCLYTCAKIIG